MSGRLEGRTTVRAILCPCYGELQIRNTSPARYSPGAGCGRAVGATMSSLLSLWRRHIAA